MYFSHSLFASAVFLSFSTTVQARVAHPGADYTSGNAVREVKVDSGSEFDRWSLRKLFRNRQTPEELDCSSNLYSNVLKDTGSDEQQSFCNILLQIPPATTEVDFTPTITKTTTSGSTATIVKTTRIVTTEILTETATVTPASILPRAANLAAKINAINAVITSVIDSGTSSPSLTSTNNVTNEAIPGLSTACLCLNVDPTSTDTVTFTAPPVETTINKFILRLETNIVTKQYTTTTTVTVGFNQTASQSIDSASSVSPTFSSYFLTSNGSLSTAVATSGGVELSASSSALISNPSTLTVSTTSSLTATVITSGGGVPSVVPSSTARAIATALPFSCPDDDGKSITNVVGSEMFEYAILCNTAVVTKNEIFTVLTSNATDCAVECSYVNDVFQKDLCQAATFTASPGSDSGACLVSGAATTYIESPGSITVALKGVYTPNENCAAIDFTQGHNNSSIDTSAAIASITSASLSVSTPGFITSTGAGGVFHTYVSEGTTGTDGIYRYSWYEKYESSSYWLAIYSAPRTCVINIPRTIVMQYPGNSTSIVDRLETTIINGGATTIIVGTSTHFFTAGNGAVTPSSTPASTPASTTSGGGVFTTASLTASQTVIGGETPSMTSVSSSVLSSQVGVSETLVSLGGTGIEGSGALTVSGGVSTFNSTRGGGTGLPSPSVTAQPDASPSVILNGTTILTSGGAEQSSSQSTSTSNSTGGGGSAGLSQTSGVTQETIIPSATNGSFAVTLSSASATSNFTASGGSAAPSLTSGGAVETQSFSIATFNVTGGGGYGQPAASTPQESFANSTGPSATSGGAQQTISSQTTTTNATGGGGTSLPSPTSPSNGTSIITGLPLSTGSSIVIPSVNGTVLPSLSTADGLNFTISGSIAVTSINGGSGAITPSANGSGTAPTSFMPTPSLNASFTTGPAFSNSLGDRTGRFSSLSTPSSQTNITSTIGSQHPSITLPPASINATSLLPATNTTGPAFTNSDDGRRGSFSRSRSSGISGFGSPPNATSNATLWPGTSESSRVNFTQPTETASSFVPTASANSSASIPLNTGVSVTPINSTRLPAGTGSSSVPQGTGSSILPSSANTTFASIAIPSTPSVAASLGTGSSSIPQSWANVTASSSLPVPSLNASLPVGTGSSTLPSPSTNVTVALSTGGTTFPSVPTVSANSSVVAGNGSSAIPTPSANTTIPLSTGVHAPSSSIPTVSVNSSLSSANSTGIFSTGPTAASSAILPTSTNSTSFLATGSRQPVASTASVALPLNSTVAPSLVTGNVSSVPSATTTVSLNSTAAEVCPSATGFTVLYETVTTVATIAHTIPLEPSSCLSSTGNGTLLPGTGTPSQPTYSTSTIATIASSASAALSLRRLANTTATPDQIKAACNDTDNIIFNPGFELANDNIALGWSDKPDDSFISYHTFPSPNQHTRNGQRAARVLSAAADRTIIIWQPVTLCPGKTYRLSSFNRQANLLAQCTVEYSIGDKEIFTASPQEAWLQRSEFYTAGTTPAQCSPDLRIKIRCVGEGGAPTGTDDAGMMVVEFDDVELVQV